MGGKNMPEEYINFIIEHDLCFMFYKRNKRKNYIVKY